MSYTVQEQLNIARVSITSMDYGLINHYVRALQEGQYITPQGERLAKAALALQEAYAERNYCKIEDDHPWKLSDEEMMAKAVASFNEGDPKIHLGLRRDYVPLGKTIDDHVLIHALFLNERLVYEGRVVKVLEYPNGTGWIIQITELIDKYLFNGPRSKYTSIWAPHDYKNKMAGILYS